MPHISSIDATICAADDLIYALQNPAPESQLFKLGNGKKGGIEYPRGNIQKIKPPEVPPRVPVREVFQDKLQEVNQEISQMKIASQ